MDIIISNADNKPIYEQIYTQIRNSILSGKLKEGDLLPSIRTLAKDLRISVITTKRAYDELEKDGFLHTVAGKGCYVAEENSDLIREANLKQIEEHLQEAAELAGLIRLDEKELAEMLQMAINNRGAENTTDPSRRT